MTLYRQTVRDFIINMQKFSTDLFSLELGFQPVSPQEKGRDRICENFVCVS